MGVGLRRGGAVHSDGAGAGHDQGCQRGKIIKSLRLVHQLE
jgi:hypothetical protein